MESGRLRSLRGDTRTVPVRERTVPDAPAPEQRPTGGTVLLARVRRHLAWLIVAKLALLALLYALFFSPDHRPEVTPERVDRLLLLVPGE